MMISFDNRKPDSFMLEQLLEQNTNVINRLPALDQTSQLGHVNDRYIAAYDNNQLVGFGHLSMEAPTGAEGSSAEIFITPNHRNPELKQTIHKLLHARKYSRSI